jgi:hypothetical protein
MDNRIYKALAIGRQRNFIKTGDPIVVVTGWRTGTGYTNTMRLINTPENDGGPIVGTQVITDYND